MTTGTSSAVRDGRLRLLQFQRRSEHQALVDLERRLASIGDEPARDALRWALATLLEQQAAIAGLMRQAPPHQREAARRFADELTLEPRLHRLPPPTRRTEAPRFSLIRGALQDG